MTQFDDSVWLAEWETLHDRRYSGLRTDSSEREYWSMRARDFSESRRTDGFGYGKKVCEKLMGKALSPDSVVLDVGAGPGTFVVPFAPRVRRIDGLEPAPGMVSEMKKNAEKEGLKDYGIIEKSWEEVDFCEEYDLVISSLVLFVFRDIWRQILRLERASRGYCAIVTGTGTSRCPDDLWSNVMGGTPFPWSSDTEYPLIFNLLRSRKRIPNVGIIEYTSRRLLENKVRHRSLCFQRYAELSEEMEDMIRNYYTKRSRDGYVEETSKAAIIWWKKPQ
ncbi:class I SAM-dependent methyltransferase [Marispirochaeta sp.]|jgi:SAM-dependent methyltransferase|uniref:class I SAM-dependent methyltransferase n=1 Tax=Marispirochaeta sp. TaxID=2038653 RepID=UPI0029C6B30D|nr:class I SAM-dependent methyltransferase [Marispirochaeta sp.]